MSHRQHWSAPSASAKVRASVSVPGSKSLTNRYLAIAALAGDDSTIAGALDSRDTALMQTALEQLGARFCRADDGTLRVAPIPEADGAPSAQIDCGLAGTVMRFVPAIAAAVGRTARFDGDPEARVRPMSTMVSALGQLGVRVSSDAGFLPMSVTPGTRVLGGHVEIDASASSQFVSALLLAGSRFDLGIDVIHTGSALPSRPHIDMTIQTLRDAGVVISEPEDGHWVVEPGVPRGIDVAIEPDLSNAATFAAAALVTGGEVFLPHWPAATTQAGDRFREIAQAFGGEVSLDRKGLTVRGPSRLRPVDLDLSAVGELTPVVAAVAALAPGSSQLRGIGHLRGHETDRLTALSTELRKVGASVDEGPDSLTILSPAQHGTQWDSYADHRMVMAGAVVGLLIPGITILNPDTVAKTLPQFTVMWEEMLGRNP